MTIVCQTCLAHSPEGDAFCSQCGQPLAPPPPPAPAAQWTNPPPTGGTTVFRGVGGAAFAPVAEPPPGPAPAGRAGSPWLWAAAIGLPVLALAVGGLLLLVLTRCDGPECAERATSGSSSSPVSGGAATPTAPTTPVGPTTAAGSAAPTVSAGAPTINGHHVYIPLTIGAPAGHPPTTCSASAAGQEHLFACADGKYEYDGEYDTQEAVTITVANAAGESAITQVPVQVPPFRAVVIHACSPPPCEPVSTHVAPYRNTNEEPSFGDGTALEIECWVRGDPYQTQFHVAGQATRSTQIFYRMRSPAPGRYIWAPFVVESFEDPVAGVRSC